MLHLIFLLVNSKPIFPVMIIKRIEVYMIIHKICMQFLLNFMSEKFIILGVNSCQSITIPVNNYKAKLFRVNALSLEM